jgi:hypothetical protein
MTKIETKYQRRDSFEKKQITPFRSPSSSNSNKLYHDSLIKSVKNQDNGIKGNLN